MSRNKAVEPSYMELLAVKEGQASKLSLGAEVNITYQLALSTDKKQIFIALLESGSQGYFSREWITDRPDAARSGSAAGGRTPGCCTASQSPVARPHSAHYAALVV